MISPRLAFNPRELSLNPYRGVSGSPAELAQHLVTKLHYGDHASVGISVVRFGSQIVGNIVSTTEIHGLCQNYRLSPFLAAGI